MSAPKNYTYPQTTKPLKEMSSDSSVETTPYPPRAVPYNNAIRAKVKVLSILPSKLKFPFTENSTLSKDGYKEKRQQLLVNHTSDADSNNVDSEHYQVDHRYHPTPTESENLISCLLNPIDSDHSEFVNSAHKSIDVSVIPCSSEHEAVHTSVNPQSSENEAVNISVGPLSSEDEAVSGAFESDSWCNPNDSEYSSTCCETSDVEVSIGEIERFVVDTVIEKFKEQRQCSQFAVLILLTKDESQNIHNTPFFPDKPEMTNREEVFMPEVHEFGNYIVARPNKLSDINIIHSEITLLKHLDDLWTGFKHIHDEEPAVLLLFSWIIPCTDCTHHIICHANERKPVKTIVVYVWKPQSCSQDTVTKTHQRFEENQILILKVVCPYYVPNRKLMRLA